MTINAAADAFATDEEMGIGGWNWTTPFFGSVNFGIGKTYSLSSPFQKVFNAILHLGKPWRNFVSFFWLTKNVLPDLELSAPNQDQTTQVQKLTSTMASPPPGFFPILLNWSLFNKSDVTLCSTFTTSQARRTQMLTILAGAEFLNSAKIHES